MFLLKRVNYATLRQCRVNSIVKCTRSFRYQYNSTNSRVGSKMVLFGPLSFLVGGVVLYQSVQAINGDDDSFSFSSAKFAISLAQSNQLILQRKGAQAIAYLAEKDDYCSSLLKEGVLEALAQLSLIRDDIIQQYVFKAICSLCNKELAKSEIVDRSWLSYFAWYSRTAVENHHLTKHETDILHLIAKSLVNLTNTSDPDLIRSIDDLGALNILHFLTLIIFPPESETKQLITEVYYNLAKYDNMRIKLCDGDGREGINLLCQSTKETILIGVAKFFTEVAKNDDARLIMVENSFLPYLVQWSSSQNNELRFQTALALAHLVENDEVAVYLLREYGSNLFLSLADINDIDVQHMVEAALNKMNKRAIDRDSPSKRVFVILDNFEIKAQQ